MGLMYRNSIKGISRVDMFNLSLDINALGMVGMRSVNIVLVKFWISEQKICFSSGTHNNLARSRMSDF